MIWLYLGEIISTFANFLFYLQGSKKEAIDGGFFGFFGLWSPCAAIHPKAHGCNWTLKNWYFHLGHSSPFGDLQSATSEHWSSVNMIVKVNRFFIGESKVVLVVCSPCLYIFGCSCFLHVVVAWNCNVTTQNHLSSGCCLFVLYKASSILCWLFSIIFMWEYISTLLYLHASIL